MHTGSRVVAWTTSALLGAGVALAGVPDSAAVEDANFRDNYLFGDWLGTRTTLWEHGIKPKFLLITDPYGNPYGGQSRGFSDYSLFCADLKLETDRLVGLPGGQFHVGFAAAFGRQLSQDYVGNVFPIQASDVSPPGPRLTDLSYTQELFDEVLSLKAGRVSIDSLYGQEFAASAYFRSFTSVAFNAIPFAIFYNAPGAFGYPATTWGARAKVTPIEKFYVMGGVYNGDPDVGLANRQGVDFSMKGPPLGIGEVGYRHNQGTGDTGLAGNLKAGGFVLGGRVPEFGSTRSSEGRYGFYAVADQAVLRFGEPETKRHLGIFGSVVVAPDSQVSPMPWYFNTGLVAYGPFDARPRDFLSLGTAYGAFSGPLRTAQQVQPTVGPDPNVPPYEMTIELSYGIQAMPGMLLQPGVQWLVNAGTSSSALALGLNVVLSF